ncbi:MAG: hypothetical protein HN981_01645 [Candidatus Pacebacteria bacterium]|jgi:hypothetical protein|nr:hypothetical protein [Candidatus Paceibacterota bacterium]MBT4652708.1 hypothetical protein [Candidatus Paceibacterota bacterium]MBT6755865.1 hypothetical protein [Candidatus Paceibacterota bacterium]MBT6921078.1 hypothetical protein [Candidatus Paceibacterota bacterium]
MKKETIIAILVGLSLGLFITYGVYQAKTSISPESDKDQEILSLTPAPENEFSGELVLNSPENEIIQEDSSISVSGTTLPNSFVVIFVDNKETITSSDESGNFSIEISLENGLNIITITVLDENGRSISTERTVIVSDDPLVSASEASDSAEVDSSEETTTGNN